MPRTACALVFLGVMFSASAQAQTDSQSTLGTSPLAFRFDWSPPCRVPVVETSEKKGKSARFRYAIDVRPLANKNLRVTLEDFTFLAIEGTDVTGKEWQARLRPAVALTSTIPAFEVSSAGEWLSVESFDAMFSRLSRFAPKLVDEKTRKIMNTPAMKTVLEQAVAGYWSGWVQSWIAWPLKPGTSTSGAAVLPLATAAKVPVTLTRRFDRLEAGYATLRQAYSMSGDAMAQAAKSMVDEVSRSAGVPTVPEDAMKEMKMQAEYSFLVETRPENLRPRHTRSEKRVTVSGADGVHSDVEIHDVEWDWAHAKGCKKR